MANITIEELKQQWLGDPSWDIEETEGFEEYRAELLLFRLEQEKAQKGDRIEKLVKLSLLMGCTVEEAENYQLYKTRLTSPVFEKTGF